ncbi:mucin-16-like [Callorhinus ursinus]|uniref:mucin-16-like n=1 Tax=Callorhinus ursinus TaxID=34884 RepID=UPI003CD02B6F
MPADLCRQRTTASSKAGPAPLGKLSKACPHHPPRSQGPAGLGSVTGTRAGGEEHSPGRPGRSMGWEGPGYPGRQRGHLLPLALSLLLICGPGTDGSMMSITNFPTYETSSWLNRDPSTPVTVVDPAGTQESVATTTRELSEGIYGGTTWSTGDPAPLVTILSLGPAGVTSFPESKVSVSVSESTPYLSTVMLSSAETVSIDTLVPSLSTVTSGVPGDSSATFSASPFLRTERGPGDAMSTIAESLPSSASIPLPSLTFTPAYSSTSPAPHGITSSLVTQRMVGTNTGAERSTAEGPLGVVSTLETWTEPVRTSLSTIVDTRMTEHINLGTVTSSSQLPPQSTQLTRTDGIVEHIPEIPNEAAHGGATEPVHVPVAPTASASPRETAISGGCADENTWALYP